MRVFVKYCGGCNPRYDRVKALSEFKDNNKNIDFTAKYDNKVDCCLIICGCNAACAGTDFIDKNIKKYTIKSKEELENLKF